MKAAKAGDRSAPPAGIVPALSTSPVPDHGSKSEVAMGGGGPPPCHHGSEIPRHQLPTAPTANTASGGKSRPRQVVLTTASTSPESSGRMGSPALPGFFFSLTPRIPWFDLWFVHTLTFGAGGGFTSSQHCQSRVGREGPGARDHGN